jgi:hypothetical protein
MDPLTGLPLSQTPAPAPAVPSFWSQIGASLQTTAINAVNVSGANAVTNLATSAAAAQQATSVTAPVTVGGVTFPATILGINTKVLAVGVAALVIGLIMFKKKVI